MNINIHTQQITLNSAHEDAIRVKAEKLFHFADRLSDESSELKIDLIHENSKRQEDAYTCHLTFFVPQDTLRAESQADSVDNAFDESFEKIKSQIEKYKAKVHHDI